MHIYGKKFRRKWTKLLLVVEMSDYILHMNSSEYSLLLIMNMYSCITWEKNSPKSFLKRFNER